MSVVFLTSVTGSPGVTTTAVGMTLEWPRPVLLVEVDVSKPSGVLPGRLRGQMDHSRGLTPLAVLHQRGQLTPREIWNQRVTLGENRFLVPGFSNLGAAAGAGSSFWTALGTTLTAIAAQGADVIVDAGRLGIRDDRAVMMQLADVVALVARPVLPDILAINARRADLGETVAAVGREDSIGLVIVDSRDEAFRDKEIERAVKLPVFSRLANDPRAAAVYSVGAESTPRTSKSSLSRDLRLLPSVIEQAIRDRRSKLGVIPLEEVTA